MHKSFNGYGNSQNNATQNNGYQKIYDDGSRVDVQNLMPGDKICYKINGKSITFYGFIEQITDNSMIVNKFPVDLSKI
jgi:hypothetical protein